MTTALTAPAAPAPARLAAATLAGGTPTIGEEWLARLESGLYTQCTGVLHRGAAFCALGVLADVAVEDGLAQWQATTGGGWVLRIDGQSHLTSCPARLLDLAGIPAQLAGRVAVRNDHMRQTLPEIAAFIRAGSR